MSLLNVLPPSPPTTSSRKANSDGPRPYLAPPMVMSTPEDSPASMPGSSNLGSRKKVEFSAQTNTHDAAAFASSPEKAAAIKPLPPSREIRPVRRSILKPPSQAEVSIENMDGRQEEKLSVNENMDSIVQQLSKNDKVASMDAYNSLTSVFQAYDELPEAIVLKNRLSTLIRHVRRDLACQDRANSGPTDTNLVISALKLLIILVWSPTFSPLLSDEHRVFILDRSIYVISERRAPKVIVSHYLHLIATQTFRASLMTANTRASRLLDALKELPQYVTSSTIINQTVMILGRLLDQAKGAMKVKADCWAETLLRAMMSASSETRQRSLAFGIQACSAFSASHTVSSAFRDMLKSEERENVTIEMYACKRLKSMVAKEEEAIHVPQIWTAVLLLAVNSTDKLDNWPSFRSHWLEVIQKCFNCGDTAVRIHANFAWNRLVCVARPHEASDAVAALVAKPLVVQLDRSGYDKQSHNSRMSALSSYCNLLYYAFRPKATHKQYTRSWNDYIVKIMRTSFFEKNPTNGDFACRIFMALTWNPARITKIWNESRAHDNAAVEPEELPTIDAKWLRRNCGTLLRMFEILFKHSSWNTNTTTDQAFVVGAWKHFAKALGEAASKEIKASSETVQAATQVVTFVQQLWQQGQSSTKVSADDADTLTRRLSFLLRVVIAELGPAPFVDVLENEDVILPAILLQTFAAIAIDTTRILHNAANYLGEAYLSPRPGAPTSALLERILSRLDLMFRSDYESLSQERRDINNGLDLLDSCLRDGHDDVGSLTLRTVQTSLERWLEDKDRSPAAAAETELLRLETSDRIADMVIPALGRLPSQMIAGLDGLFAAGFSSTHKETINQMVSMWNQTHGQVPQLNIGPDLTIALTRLRPYVDLQLMNLELHDYLHVLGSGENSAPPVFLDFAESQSQLAMTSHLRQTDEKVEVMQGSIPPFDDRSNDVVLDQDFPGTTTSRSQSSHSTPQRSRRHNDSQVQFQPIDSSPPTAVQEESQFLTKRQKEVRDRQRQDATLYFPDIRADEALKSTHNMPNPVEGDGRALEEERPSTPKLPAQDLADFDHDPTASPTPRSKHQALRLEDIEAPSSPLSVQGEDDILELDSTQVEAMEAIIASERHVSLGQENIAMEEERVLVSTELPPSISGSRKHFRDVDENGNATDAADDLDYTHPFEQEVHNLLHEEKDGVAFDAAVNIRPDSLTRDDANTQPSNQQSEPVTSSLHVSLVTPGPSHLNSDELDMMSQSQLSQNLDWHIISKHGDDTPELNATMEDQQPDCAAEEQPVVPTFQKKRKRAQGSLIGGKRRKSRFLSRSVSEASVPTQEDDVDDCIVVDTSSRIPVTEVWTMKRKPYIERKSTRINSQEGLDSCNSPPAKITAREVLPPGTAASVANGASKGYDTTTRHGDTHKSASPAVVSDTLRVDQIVEVTAAAAAREVQQQQMQETYVPSQLHPIEDEAETSIMDSLREVLRRLKASNGEGLDLREIDDLCFHIRTEGQQALRRGSYY